MTELTNKQITTEEVNATTVNKKQYLIVPTTYTLVGDEGDADFIYNEGLIIQTAQNGVYQGSSLLGLNVLGTPTGQINSAGWSLWVKEW